MKIKSSYYKNLFFPFLLLFLILILAIQNYTPGTWLTGWDTLHPEFNFWLNLKRVIFGVWRSEQGVGAIAAHSHMGELPRILYLWLSSILFKTHFLRYWYFFSTLFLGPLGVYLFVTQLKPKSKLPGFLAAVFYLCNLVTLQQYYVPFEMFAAQFAFLPWLYLVALKYVERPKRKILIWALGVGFLSSPQAYAATLFYLYFSLHALFLGGFSLLQKKKLVALKRSLTVLGFILVANLFWILPNLYSLAKQSETIANSQINQLFSPEAFLRNKEYGTPEDLVLGRNFLFSWRELDTSTGQFVPLMDEWINHLSKTGVKEILYTLFALNMFGFFVGILRKDKISMAFTPPFVLVIFFLLNANPPFGFVYEWLRQNSGLFSEGLRTPFTKVSFSYTFFLSYFLASAFVYLFKILQKLPLKLFTTISTATIFLLVVFYSMLPAFAGNFISPSMKVNIPQEYFDFYDWINKQPDGKIAKFPVYTHWGWVYHSWGYQGAGFSWFGSKQSQFDRDFDRWSSYNEDFYQAISQAVYAQNKKEFFNALQKYNIRYVFIDHSVVNPGSSNQDILAFDLLSKWLTEENTKNVFEFGFITVYEIETNEEVTTPNSFKNLTASDRIGIDQLYSRYGNYLENESRNTLPFNLESDSLDYTLSSTESIIIKSNRKLDDSLLVGDYLDLVSQLPISVWLMRRDSGIEVEFKLETPILKQEDSVIYDPSVSLKDILEVRDEIGFISLNQKASSVMDLNTLKRQFTTLSLPKDEYLTFNLYGKEGKDLSSLEKQFLESKGRVCADASKQIPSKSIKKLIFDLNKESLCLGNSYKPDIRGLLEISFTFSGSISSVPFFCVSDGSECINEEVPQKLSLFGQDRLVTYLVPVTSQNYWLDLVFPAAAEESGEVAVTNLSFSFYPELATQDYYVWEDYQRFVGNEKITINRDRDLLVEIPTVGVILEDFAINKGYFQARNCDLLQEGQVKKNMRGGAIIYSAFNNATNCDYLPLPNINHSQAGLLRVIGENYEGRSLKIYLYAQGSDRVVLEKLLPEGDFDEWYYLPSLNVNNEGSGYTLNFETRSFGRIASINKIDKVEFVPLPKLWLDSIKSGEVEGEVDNNLHVVRSEKVLPLLYKVVANSNFESGIFTLSQAYDGGWIAFDKKLTAFKHLKFNGWANAWEVPQGEYTVYIFYWPQLLQFIGFLSLLFVSSYLILKR